jgi:acetyl/propionyl-CoA carboxylase alpha subunit
MATKYIVTTPEEQGLEVVIAEEGEGYRLVFDGRSVYVDVSGTPSGPTRSLLVEGRSYEAATIPGRNGFDVYVSGDGFHVKVVDELWARAEVEAGDTSGGGETVVSPMPGSMIKIAVVLGQTVAPGDPVAIVEAMKMQNEITAVRGGVVREIQVQPGDVVDQDTVLVVLGPLETAS